jgi:hypothetical protein
MLNEELVKKNGQFWQHQKEIPPKDSFMVQLKGRLSDTHQKSTTEKWEKVNVKNLNEEEFLKRAWYNIIPFEQE